MKNIISLGYNCEVSFQIEKYINEFDASLFSWAYICNDTSFLRALDNIDDIFTDQVHFHMQSDDMFYDEKYDMTFHGRTHKDAMFDKNGNIIDNDAYDECIAELRSRLDHLKEKFKQQLVSRDKKIFIRKLKISDKQNCADAVQYIRKLNEILNSKVKGGRYKLYVVIEKEFLSRELKNVESGRVFIRTVDYFAPDSDTKDGADHKSWKAIFDEILGRRMKRKSEPSPEARITTQLRKVLESVKENGLRVTLIKIKNKLR